MDDPAALSTESIFSIARRYATAFRYSRSGMRTLRTVWTSTPPSAKGNGALGSHPILPEQNTKPLALVAWANRSKNQKRGEGRIKLWHLQKTGRGGTAFWVKTISLWLAIADESV